MSISASKGVSSVRNAIVDTMECCIHSAIANAGIKETELVWKFFSMVEFSGATVDGITPMNFTDPQQNQFAINMLKAFEEFDQNLNPPGLITKQFEAIAQKCKENQVRLLIGKAQESNEIGVDSNNLRQDNIFINFSKDMVKKQMNKPIFIIQKNNNGSHEIKAIPLGNLVAGQENVNFDDPALIAKCAAYLLFHELFHVNSFLDCQCNTDIYNSFSSNYENLKLQPDEIFCLKKIFDNQAYIDDAINTSNISVNDQNRIPGEFELLASIQSDKQIMRIYTGQENWNTDIEKMTYCSKIFNRSFNCPQDNKIHDLLIKTNEVLDFKNRIININFPLNPRGSELVMFNSISAFVSQIKQKMNAIEIQHLHKFVILLNTINDQYANPCLLNLKDLEYTYKELKKTIQDLNFSKDLCTQIYIFLNQRNCFVLEQKIETLQMSFNLLQKSVENISHEDKNRIKRIEQLLSIAKQYIYNEIKVLPPI